MSRVPEKVKAFMDQWGVDQDEVWLLPGGRSYAVKHAALERIAVAVGILWDDPDVVAYDLESKTVVVRVKGRILKKITDSVGGAVEAWSFGEAAPYNNKNAYPWAMAEKRAKDRVILKLLAVHGLFYGEDELDEPAPRKERDIAPHDDPRGDIPIPRENPNAKSAYSIRKGQPAAWNEVVEFMHEAEDPADLKTRCTSEWFAEKTRDWPASWLQTLRIETYQSILARFQLEPAQ